MKAFFVWEKTPNIYIGQNKLVILFGFLFSLGGGCPVFTVAEAVVQYFIKINHEVLRDLFYIY